MSGQGPGDPPVVSVQGEAVLEVEPELAVFAATLSTTGRDRHQVLAGIGDLHKRTWSALVSVGDPVTVETGFVGVHPRYDDGPPGRRPPFFEATAHLSVEVSDFALLPDVLAVLSSVRDLGFTGPSWQLRPTSPVQRRARTAAIRDALRRAEEYAGALGCTLTDLVDVTDAADGRGGRVLVAAEASTSAAPRTGEGQGLSLDLRPVRQRVTGVVRARFRTTVPDLDALLAGLHDGR